MHNIFLVLDLDYTGDNLIKFWGKWYSWQICPEGSYVISLQTKVEPSTDYNDDTALNGISLRCNDAKYTQITSGVAEWGTWYDESPVCNNGFYGGMIIVQALEVIFIYVLEG